MQQICTECWEVQHNTSVLRYMIINKYPLPVSSASTVEKTIRKLLGKMSPDFTEFELVLLDKERKTVYREGQSKNICILRLTLTLHQGHFYVTRNNLSKVEEIGIPCFLYDGLCQLNEQFGLTFHTADEFINELVDFLEY